MFHAVAMGRAHTRPARDLHAEPGLLDQETRKCLTCHDGFAARSVIGADDWASTGHPIGHSLDLPYRTARRRPDRRLRPEDSIELPVHLVDGKIGCGTCHSVYSAQPRMLWLSLRGSRLCRACHDM